MGARVRLYALHTDDDSAVNDDAVLNRVRHGHRTENVGVFV